MAGLKPPKIGDKLVPVFTGDELAALLGTCKGGGFQNRRDYAIISVFKDTGIRLSELAQIRYDHHDPQHSDIDLELREITVHGKGHKTRTVKISFGAARSLGRYLRARARHAQACRPQLWLAVNNRGPMTASGIYQMIARRGRECGVDVFPHRFRHHFSHTWLDRGGPEGDLMELNGWCSAVTVPAPAAPAAPEPAGPTTASWTAAPEDARAPPATPAPGVSTGRAGACALLHRAPN
jgi:integrase